jgi:hypothetical protein
MPATLHFQKERGAGDSYQHVLLITPADGADLTDATRGISIVVAGALKVVTVGGETVVIPSGALAIGIIHPLEVVRVWSTGTTATGIVGYY